MKIRISYEHTPELLEIVRQLQRYNLKLKLEDQKGRYKRAYLTGIVYKSPKRERPNEPPNEPQFPID